MKRKLMLAAILALIATLAVVMLAGCAEGGKQSAMDALAKASEATSRAKSAKFDTNFDLKASYAGFTIGADGTAKTQYILPDSLAELDKVQLALEYNMHVNALAENTSLKLGLYMKDGNVYYDLESDEADEPVRAFFSLPEELGKQLEGLLGSVDVKNLDSSDVDSLAILAKHVTSGTFENNHISLEIDIAGYAKEATLAALRKQGVDMDEAITTSARITDMFKSSTMKIDADVDGNMVLTSINVALNMEIDPSSVAGSAAGMLGNSPMKIDMTVNCPKIETNTTTPIDFPSFEGYEDITDELTAYFEQLVSEFSSMLPMLIGGSGSGLGPFGGFGSSNGPGHGNGYGDDFDYSFGGDGGLTDKQMQELLDDYGIDINIDMGNGGHKPGKNVSELAGVA